VNNTNATIINKFQTNDGRSAIPSPGTRARPRRQAQERHRRHQPDEISARH
jgi:hypothetical protein